MDSTNGICRKSCNIAGELSGIPAFMCAENYTCLYGDLALKPIPYPDPTASGVCRPIDAPLSTSKLTDMLKRVSVVKATVLKYKVVVGKMIRRIATANAETFEARVVSAIKTFKDNGFKWKTPVEVLPVVLPPPTSGNGDTDPASLPQAGLPQITSLIEGTSCTMGVYESCGTGHTCHDPVFALFNAFGLAGMTGGNGICRLTCNTPADCPTDETCKFGDYGDLVRLGQPGVCRPDNTAENSQLTENLVVSAEEVRANLKRIKNLYSKAATAISKKPNFTLQDLLDWVREQKWNFGFGKVYI